MTAERCQMLHAVVYFSDIAPKSGREPLLWCCSHTDRRMNYEIIWLLSPDTLPDVVESKRANVCDAVRGARAYTVTFYGWILTVSLKDTGFVLKAALGSF